MAFQDTVINGTNFVVKVDTTGGSPVTVGCATSHTFDISNSAIEVACKDTGGWTANNYGRNSWTCSVDALVNFDHDGATRQGYEQLVDLMIARTKVDLEATYTDPTTSDTYVLSGTAVIESISQNSPDQDNGSWSVSFMGDGALTATVTET